MSRFPVDVVAATLSRGETSINDLSAELGAEFGPGGETHPDLYASLLELRNSDRLRMDFTTARGVLLSLVGGAS